MKRRSGTFLSVSLLFLGQACIANADTILFDQLNWFGTSTSTPDSSWGRATLQFPGYSSTQYFNLNVDGNWVVENMSIGSAGTPQTLTTMFDLGVPHGSNVTSLNYVSSVSSSPLSAVPTGTFNPAAVSDLDYQIGGEDDIDLGSPGQVDRGAPSVAVVTNEGKIPNGGKFVNQPQGPNDCVRAAVSNSLNYLKATGKIGFSETMSEVQAWAGRSSGGGTPSDWYSKKKTHLEAKGMTVRFIEAPLTIAKVMDLISQLKDGQDIEVDLRGHAEDLVGLRLKSDGTVDFDLYDDNQTDGNVADPMHTSPLTGLQDHYIDGMLLERFVIECPEPTSLLFFFVGLGLATRARLRERH